MSDKPPKRPSFPENEADTKPDMARFKCGSCTDSTGKATGEVVTETWDNEGNYVVVRRPCDVCWGNKWLTREQLEKWRARTD